MRRTVYWFPIENLPERYSGQWNRWFKSEFEGLEVKNLMIYGTTLADSIRQGSFLDIVGTNYYKADQLKQFCFMVDNNLIKDNDIILLHDGWFSGIEMLAYIRDALGLKFKIYAIFHAGVFDPHDFLTQKGMRKWAKYLERCWFEMYDGIFVATNFSKELFFKGINHFETDFLFFESKGKIHVTGLPIYPEFVKPCKKENIIVFPHRLDPEKQPEVFDFVKEKLQKDFSNWQFLKTKGVCKTKQEYYNLLNKAKISVSCALQETWGIAMIESVLCGCSPIVPNRLSYKELYPETQCYNTKKELVEMVKNEIEIWEATPIGIIEEDLKYLQNEFIYLGSRAIQNMVGIMLGDK
jgi:glycosyltransferase involved in cell wall biosynthesis